MTDLPTIEAPVPPKPQTPEKWELHYVEVARCEGKDRRATLEDVITVLEAAGYIVAKKEDFKFDVRPFSFAQPAVEYGHCRSKPLEETTERMRDLALSVRVGLAKLDWGVIKAGLLAYDGITIGGIREGTSDLDQLLKAAREDVRICVEHFGAEKHRCSPKIMESLIESVIRLRGQTDDGATVGAALLQQRLDEAKKIARDAIRGLNLLDQAAAADALMVRLDKL